MSPKAHEADKPRDSDDGIALEVLTRVPALALPETPELWVPAVAEAPTITPEVPVPAIPRSMTLRVGAPAVLAPAASNNLELASNVAELSADSGGLWRDEETSPALRRQHKSRRSLWLVGAAAAALGAGLAVWSFQRLSVEGAPQAVAAVAPAAVAPAAVAPAAAAPAAVAPAALSEPAVSAALAPSAGLEDTRSEGPSSQPAPSAAPVMRFEDLPVDRPAAETSSKSKDAEESPGVPPGVLSINSLPASSVFINGKPYGQTPQVGVQLRPGRYAVVFHHPKLGKRKETLRLESGKKRVVSMKF